MRTEPLPYSGTTINRRVAKEAQIAFKNRFLEQNPILNGGNPTSAISRPSLKKFTEVGTGPIRSVFTAEGLFNDTLFVVSGTELYRVDASGVPTFLEVISSNSIGDVYWAPVASIGDVPARLFFAEGGVLWVYTDNGEALGLLEVTGAIADNDVIRIGDTYYQFTTGSVDVGTPAGTAGSPWLVAKPPIDADALVNLSQAIDMTGEGGVTYSTALTQHPDVRAGRYTATDLFVNARVNGADGNSIVTTSTGAGIVWGSGTLTGGGEEQVRQVATPGEVGAVSVAHINSFVIVVPVQSEDLGTTGRFYWIEPGETFIDPLDFATAERSSDKLHQVVVFNNLFWLCGQKTTEPWITTGIAEAPMRRFDSILFDRGSWEGTAVQVKDSMIVVDEDGGVFQIQGGMQRISRPDIEERIRRAIQIEEFS